MLYEWIIEIHKKQKLDKNEDIYINSNGKKYRIYEIEFYLKSNSHEDKRIC